MEPKCFFDKCKEPIKYCCPCSLDYIFFCLPHMGVHIENSRDIKHPIEFIYRPLSSNLKSYLIQGLNRSCDNILRIKSNIVSILTGGIAQLNSFKEKTEKYFREEYQEIQELIEKITRSNQEFSIPGYDSNYFLPESFESYLETLCPNINPIINGCTNQINNLLNDFKSYKDFFFDQQLDYSGNANLDENLFFFRNGTKVLIEFDTSNLEVKEHQYNVNQNQGYLAAVCQVPGRKLFHLGGKGSDNSCAYLIDLYNSLVEQIPNSISRSYTSATYYKKYVYIFGGYINNKNSSKCDRINLVTKQWSSLASFPEGPKLSICTLPHKNSIILASDTGNTIYSYNIPNNSYTPITSDVDNYCYNILIRDSGKYYYLANKNCYKSIEKKLQRWVKSAKSLSIDLSYITSKPVTRGRKVYFVSTYSSAVYMFNLDTEDASLVINY